MLQFSVRYQLKVAVHNNGEYSDEISVRLERMITTSNYLPDIMADIYEKHRSDYFLGVEIKEVEFLQPSVVHVSERSISMLNHVMM
jgi:hypothetical protein